MADLLRARTAVRESALARRLSQPIPTSADFRAAGPLPDVYLIVLDEYANAAVLRERFDFDNRMFEDSLRQLGFTVPRAVRSNYAHTILSLPSLLNFSHLTGLTQELGSSTTDPTLPDYLLEHNRTVPFLKSRGYRFLLFPSQWWPATRHSAYADQELEVWQGLDFGRELTRTHFRRSLARMTPLGQLFQEPPYDGEHIKRTLEALEAVPARPERTFVFAHVMNPHYPYVFQSDCTSVPPHGASRKRVAYVNQLRCLNRMILEVVTALIRGSATDPIIILQGDHGTSTLNFSWAPSAARVSPAQARERFGAFGAYHFPGGGGRLLSDTVTVVNVMQKVLSVYFGADVPPAANELYMSIERRPYDFVRVNPVTWATVPPSRAGGGRGARRRGYGRRIRRGAVRDRHGAGEVRGGVGGVRGLQSSARMEGPRGSVGGGTRGRPRRDRRRERGGLDRVLEPAYRQRARSTVARRLDAWRGAGKPASGARLPARLPSRPRTASGAHERGPLNLLPPARV